MEREKLTLTKEQAREIAWGDDPNLEIISERIIGRRRWSVDYEVIVKRCSDGKLFRDKYSVGATEGQDERPWEYTEPDFREVFPKEKTIVVYE